MHQADADLSPNERRREIAAILAAGILRLKARPGCLPESATSGPKCAPEKLSDSAQKPLDLSATQSPHVHGG